MNGVALSRWTMSFFAAALVALLGAELLMVLGYGYPAAGLQAPQTLLLVHLVTIGWLSLLLCGALFQFVPVLVAKPLYSDWLPLPVLACLLAGLAALLAGFLQMTGTISPQPLYFLLAAVLLGAGFTLTLWNLGRTLWPARPLPVPAAVVAVGLAAVAGTAAYGIIFALVLGGFAVQEPFPSLMAHGIPLHAIAGLGGWLTFTAMGVSYRLLAMFMLAPEPAGWRPRAVLWLGATALALVILGGAFVILLGDGIGFILGLAAILGLATVLLYSADGLRLYRARRRRNIELNSRMAAFAIASLAAAVVLMIGLAAFDRLGAHVDAVVYLVAFGWLSGLALSKLYKIVAFLTWLECYGPVLGKTTTPRVQDLVVEKRAAKWFIGWFAVVWTGTIALLFGQALVFRLAAAGMFLATLGIVVQLVRTRRLLDVAAASRLPEGVYQPHLLHTLPRAG